MNLWIQRLIRGPGLILAGGNSLFSRSKAPDANIGIITTHLGRVCVSQHALEQGCLPSWGVCLGVSTYGVSAGGICPDGGVSAQGSVCLGGVYPGSYACLKRGVCPGWGVFAPNPLRQTQPVPEMTTEAGDTHPTGMHSCCQFRLVCKKKKCNWKHTARIFLAEK